MIRFDEGSHTYRDGRGQLVPGVTFMLRCVGAAAPVRPYMRKALARGRAVHKAIELFLRGQLDLPSVDRIVMPYFECFLDWYAKYCPSQFVRMRPEVVLEGPGGLYAGKADVVAWEKIPPADAVLDWKTGEEEECHLVQDMLYCLAQNAKAKRVAFPFVIYLRPKKGWKVVTPQNLGETTRKALAVLDVFALGRARHMRLLGLEAFGEEDQ